MAIGKKKAKGRPLGELTVVRTEQLSGHMVRVWLGGDGFDNFTLPGGDGTVENHDTDMYVKLVFAPAGVEYPNPFNPVEVRDTYPPEQQPILRTYTVRTYDPVAREIAIDFVVHGDEGVAGPWARGAQPGERVRYLGPGSGYRPSPDAPWHLLASDESGLPAVAAALEALPEDARGQVFIEIGGADDEIALTAPSGVEITWVHRGTDSASAGDEVAGANAPLVAAVRGAAWLDGVPQVFIHGEAQAVMHNLRGYIRKERGVPAGSASISGYWRRGRTEEGFRQWKADLHAAESAAGVG